MSQDEQELERDPVAIHNERVKALADIVKNTGVALFTAIFITTGVKLATDHQPLFPGLVPNAIIAALALIALGGVNRLILGSLRRQVSRPKPPSAQDEARPQQALLGNDAPVPFEASQVINARVDRQENRQPDALPSNATGSADE